MEKYQVFWGSADDQNSMEGGYYKTRMEAWLGANAWLEELLSVCGTDEDRENVLAGAFTVIDSETGEKVARHAIEKAA